MKKDFLTPQAAADNPPVIDGTFEQALRELLLPKL